MPGGDKLADMEWWQTAVSFAIGVVSVVVVPFVVTTFTRHSEARTRARDDRVQAAQVLIDALWKANRAERGALGEEALKASNEALLDAEGAAMKLLTHLSRRESVMIPYIRTAVPEGAYNDEKLADVAVNLASWARGEKDLSVFTASTRTPPKPQG